MAASGRDSPLARNDSKTPVANQSNCTLLHSEVKTVWRVEAPTGAILPAGTLAAAVQRPAAESRHARCSCSLYVGPNLLNSAENESSASCQKCRPPCARTPVSLSGRKLFSR